MPGRRRSGVKRSRTVTRRPKITRRGGRSQRATPVRNIKRTRNVTRVKRQNIKRSVRRNVQARSSPRPRPAARPASRPRRVLPRIPTRTPKPQRQAVRPVKRRVRRPVAARPPARPVRSGGAARAAAALGGLVFNAAAAHPQIAAESTALESALVQLNDQSTFNGIAADIASLDAAIQRVLDLLASARDKGYRYQGDLEDLAYQAAHQWGAVRGPLETDLQSEAQAFQDRLAPLSGPLKQLNAVLGTPEDAVPLLQTTQSAVNGLLGETGQVQSRLEAVYAEVETQINQLNQRLTQIHWALEQLETARFSLEKAEGLVMAVSARWDEEADDDPEGILYLTDARILFEQKEKEATKKVLFLTLASELVHELLIDERLDQVHAVKAASKGLFGHQDFLEVAFKSPELEVVDFHLNGQDSENWAALIERARTGRLAEDLATDTGISLSELSGPLTQASIVTLQGELNELQDEMMLKDVREDLEELENDVRSLERELAKLRAKGYAIEKNLEADLAILVSQWDRVKANAEKTLAHQTNLLSEQMQTVQQQQAALVGRSGDLAQARPQFLQIKSALASAEAQADAASSTVVSQYEDYAEEIEAFDMHLDWVSWMIDALATASFRLLSTESGVAATEAVWARPNADPENGILFLTDQRLIWEDRVGDYEVKFETPLSQVEEIKVEEAVGGQPERLLFRFGAEAQLPQTRFEPAQPVGEAWLKMVGRARAGDYQKDRAEEIDPEELARVAEAPVQCPNCGAAFTAPVLRGQNEIVCEFCRVITRLG